MSSIQDRPLTIESFLPLSRMAEIAESAYATYANANPFSHVVFDNFFDPALLDRILSEFPKPGEIAWQRFDNEQEIKTIVGNPNAIGYVSVGTAEFEAARKTPIKLLPVSGMPATTASVAGGHFPFSRPLNLVTKSASLPTGLVKDFLVFAMSPAVADLVRAQFFVPPHL